MSAPRKAPVFLALLLLLAAACVLCAAASGLGGPAGREPCRRAARQLGLVDLALWYEAMHTRHPSQADAFAAFGDFPGAPEHFPSGSLAPPPRIVTAVVLADGSAP